MKINNISAITTITNKETKTNQKQNAQYTSHPQMKSLSNVYYTPISFGRSIAEHKSWGAKIDPITKEASFKILTYPDTKRVTVTVEKRDSKKEPKTYELENVGEGIFQSKRRIPAGEVEHGDRYFYTIEKGNGDIDKVKDPYSFRQETLLGESTVYDHSLYQWNDREWFENNTNRISRIANKNNGLKPVDSACIYELNIASLTKKGTFESAKEVIKKLPELGFNAIEIMPVENTFSFNWGYDGVDKMAPSEHLGGPDGLKSLVDFAHEQGLNVIMDIVPNHLGPDGASLKKTGPFIKGNNQFGEAFNFEGENSKYVRDYIVNAALNWLENYHCDGLRLDMTKFMESDYTMKQIAAEVNYHKPDAFLIAEDSRSSISVDDNGNFWNNWDEPHDKRVVNPLKSFESGIGQSEAVHCEAIEKIANGETTIGRLGFDSEWDFNYYHQLKNGLYGIIDLDAFEKACYCAQDRVKYVMSHDEIGNFEGSRLISKLLVPMLQLNENVILNKKDIERAKALSKKNNQSLEAATQTVRFQKAQFTAEKLATLLQSGKLKKYDTSTATSKPWANAVDRAFTKDILEPLGIKPSSDITFNRLQTMYQKCTDKFEMALARTYSIPGPKMVFQGDESADLTPFRFFRQFDSVRNEEYLYTEKGYTTGIEALKASTLGSTKLQSTKFRNLSRDLNIITKNNPALTRGVLVAENTVKHHASKVLGTHAKDTESRNEIFSITNFSDASYPRNDASAYYIKFPAGKWVEIINTEDKKYGGNSEFNNTNIIESNGYDNSAIKLAGQSTKIFKRVG